MATFFNPPNDVPPTHNPPSKNIDKQDDENGFIYRLLAKYAAHRHPHSRSYSIQGITEKPKAPKKKKCLYILFHPNHHHHEQRRWASYIFLASPSPTTTCAAAALNKEDGAQTASLPNEKKMGDEILSFLPRELHSYHIIERAPLMPARKSLDVGGGRFCSAPPTHHPSPVPNSLHRVAAACALEWRKHGKM